MMTEKLFYQDSHLAAFEARVLACGEADKADQAAGRTGYRVELDRTAFFPEGGGQYADTGILGGVRVTDVQEEDGRVIHFTDGPLEDGAQVEGSIDWEERFMKMQQHTGEHIVSGLVHARFGYDNVGFHLGSEDCTMDFNGEITEEQLSEIELEANRAVWKNLKVETIYPPREELAQMEYRSKIEIEGQVRIIVIPGYDRCACCAPHVAYTGEIGVIKLTNVQRYKGGARVTMLCGVRALADYALKQRQEKEICAMLCAKDNETAEGVRRLKEECSAVKYELGEKEKKLIRYEAERIPEGEDAVCIFTEDIKGESMRLLMNAALDSGHSLCAVFHPESGSVSKAGKEKRTGEKKGARPEKVCRYVIGSRDIDVRPLAKDLNSTFQGRGGGKAGMVQGTAVGEEDEIRKWFLEKAEELR